MLRNFFITALRNFKNNKTYALLNIFGLGIGIASCLFVFTLINYEYSFDKFHEKKDRIYRVVRHYHGTSGIGYTGIIPYPTGDAIIADIPDFEEVVQFHGPEDEKIALTDHAGNFQVFRESGILYTDENFFDVLDFRILSGAQAESLKEPYKAYLTQAMAEKYFGTEDPKGKFIRLNNENDLEVVGVVENPRKNTNLPFRMIVSLPTMRERIPDVFKGNWGMTWAYTTYVLAPEGADIAGLEAKLDQMMEKHLDEDEKEKLQMKLQPLTEIHNDERYGDGNYYVTPALMIWAFVILGALLIGTACLNFINLATAQAIKRAKEVGVRKTLGGLRGQLMVQFMVETFTTVLAAMVIGFTLGQILISSFNDFLTEVSYSLSYDPVVIIFAVALTLIVTLLAGFYPALILSGYKPVDALHNKINIRKGSGNFRLRRALVITQFAFTNLMLISTIIIAVQMDYVQSKDLGFQTENVVMVDFPGKLAEKLEAISGVYRSKSYVADITKGYSAPMSGSNWNNSYSEKGGTYQDGNNANMKFGDENYLDFYDIELIAGRNITARVINDSTFDAVVNTKLITSLGWNTPDEALGQWIDLGSRNAKIVGIMEDFNVNPLHREVQATVLTYDPNEITQLSIRLNRPSDTEIVSDLEATFREFCPGDLFEFSILKDEIKDRYLLENMLHQVIQFVCLLAILLSAMGLYGLVSFMANKNAKSIGIRKVFGASIPNILGIFAREYAILLVLAFILSAPGAWWLSSLWLDEFAYRIDISLIYFAVGFLLSLCIAMGTVGYRSYVAANMNPVKSLRYE